MQKVSVIGVGNAGGQTAELGNVCHGFTSLVLNTSSDDVVGKIEHSPVILLGDEKGAGQDRRIAKRFLRNGMEAVLSSDQIKEVIEDSDVVFVIGSTDGGSGSGIVPTLTESLNGWFIDKKFIAVGILPVLSENTEEAALENTIEFLREVKKFELTYMLYDNGATIGKMPFRDALKKVNQDIVDDIAMIRGDFQKSTRSNSIDSRDSMKIINTAGRLLVERVSGFREKDLTDKSIDDLLLDQMNKSTSLEVDLDSVIRRMGVIVNITEKMDDNLDLTLPKIVKRYGAPVEKFKHHYVTADTSEPTFAGIMMSGLSMPSDWITKADQIIAEGSARASRSNAYDLSVIDAVDTSSIRNLRRDEPVRKQMDIDKMNSLFEDDED